MASDEGATWGVVRGFWLPNGVSSNGANRPKLQTWPNVAPFGQPGIGSWVELQNLGVTVQKLPFLIYCSLLIGLVWGPRDGLVLELQRQRNGTEVQTGPFGGAPKRCSKRAESGPSEPVVALWCAAGTVPGFAKSGS